MLHFYKRWSTTPIPKLPTDKFDMEAITRLAQAPQSEIVEALPELLTCLQDMNWPIAEPALELLLQFPNEITPLVEDVLRGHDYDWQYWCLEKVVPVLPFYSKMLLADAIEKIATNTNPALTPYAEAANKALESFLPQ